MLSLRRVLLQGNNIVVLPDSFCLLTGLEVLDVHKNAITSLPAAMGKMSGLQKLDISENKLTELPISFCELNEALQLSVGRNPLEKPSIEQARQGVGSIRRFFGWSKPKGGEDTTDAPLEAALAAANAEGGWAKKDIERPVRAQETRAVSRHLPSSPVISRHLPSSPTDLIPSPVISGAHRGDALAARLGGAGLRDPVLQLQRLPLPPRRCRRGARERAARRDDRALRRLQPAGKDSLRFAPIRSDPL